jgi:hypothetical protein
MADEVLRGAAVNRSPALDSPAVGDRIVRSGDRLESERRPPQVPWQRAQMPEAKPRFETSTTRQPTRDEEDYPLPESIENRWRLAARRP